MSGEEFLDVANRLLKAQTEAAYRTIVNRAYYAAFHICAAFLTELGFKTSDGPQAHGELRARINNCGVTELQDVYAALRQLYFRRRKADYDLRSPMFGAQASIALDIASAGQIIAAVKHCQQSQDLRIQIRNGIREYERKINP